MLKKNPIDNHRADLIDALSSLDPDWIELAAAGISTALKSGNKVLACGNGGSAAQAQHFCAELECSYRNKDRKGYPAMALHPNTSSLTAFSNDYDFDRFYRRMVHIYGNEGDVLVAISTSGASENVLSAIEIAQQKGLKVIFLTGKCALDERVTKDIWIAVESKDTPRIQEAHMFILHEIADSVEQKMG